MCDIFANYHLFHMLRYKMELTSKASKQFVYLSTHILYLLLLLHVHCNLNFKMGIKFCQD